MDIVIIAQYLRNIENFEGNNSRFVYLAKMLAKDNNNQVEIITSDFSHGTKTHFSGVGVLEGIKITACHESGYPKNICLKRFVSHRGLAVSIGDYLKQRKKPDLIYAAVPSLSVAEVCANFCKANDVRFIVDIQDLWPEAFKMVVKIPVISDICFYPMKRQANRIYAVADRIIAVSKTYAKRAIEVNRKSGMPQVVFLGTEKTTFVSYANGGTTNTFSGITVVYIGSLAASYDIDNVIDAMAKLHNDIPVKLLVMGDGSMKKQFELHAERAGILYEFAGALPYPEMASRLVKNCDIAVNPIRKGSAGSIINKVGDYAMAGLPVVNTQECPEYRTLLDEYNAGINCECENAEDMAKAIQKLINYPLLRLEMGKNSQRLGDDLFDRSQTYERIVDLIVHESDDYNVKQS